MARGNWYRRKLYRAYRPGGNWHRGKLSGEELSQWVIIRGLTVWGAIGMRVIVREGNNLGSY